MHGGDAQLFPLKIVAVSQISAFRLAAYLDKFAKERSKVALFLGMALAANACRRSLWSATGLGFQRRSLRCCSP